MSTLSQFVNHSSSATITIAESEQFTKNVENLVLMLTPNKTYNFNKEINLDKQKELNNYKDVHISINSKKQFNNSTEIYSDLKWDNIDCLFDSMTDQDIADKFDCSVELIKSRRSTLNIDNYVKPNKRKIVDWSKYDHLLGTMSDQELADKIGIAQSSVYIRRNKLDISAYNNTSRINIDWRKYQDLLGKMTDTNLAEMIGCSIASVSMRRKKFNIPVYSEIDWGEIDQLLGKDYDINIAKKFNCDTARIFYRRRKLGIKSYRNNNIISSNSKLKSSKNYVKINNYIHNLGFVPDKVLAKELGCSAAHICNKRNSLNIKSYHEQESINWKDYLHWFKSTTDEELVSIMGCCLNRIKNIRKLYKIPHPVDINVIENAKPLKISNTQEVKNINHNFEKITWDNYINKLGLFPDTEIAKKLNTYPVKIFNMRKKLNILAEYQQERIDWTQYYNLFNINKTDQEIAEITNCCIDRVKLERKKYKNNTKFDWKIYECLFGRVCNEEILKIINKVNSNITIEDVNNYGTKLCMS
jgi:hypothetical protein